MLTLNEIFTILLVHWMADFCFQSQKIATAKNYSIPALIQHVGIYTTVWVYVTLVYIFLNSNGNGLSRELFTIGLKFCVITFIAHFFTDLITSKLVSKEFKKENYNGLTGAFTLIGLDQILHYVQLFLTYQILTR